MEKLIDIQTEKGNNFGFESSTMGTLTFKRTLRKNERYRQVEKFLKQKNFT